MCEAGRIRHHLKHHLWRREATVLLVGYQAPGTLGRLVADGAPAVRIQGEDIQVRARIRQIDVYSGHADGTELVDWVRERLPIKRALFLCHGEEDEAEAMRNALIRRDLDAERVIVPTLDDQIDLLGDGTGPRQRPAPRRLAPEGRRSARLAQRAGQLRTRPARGAGPGRRREIAERPVAAAAPGADEGPLKQRNQANDSDMPAP
jgi:metallo-beta-lactamase family protein